MLGTRMKIVPVFMMFVVCTTSTFVLGHAVEDLMQEHGLLNRILLIYEEAARKLKIHQPIDPVVLVQSAHIVKQFIEDYHERIEEAYIFPRLERAKRHVVLVSELRKQHVIGRSLTKAILKMASHPDLLDKHRLVKKLIYALEEFVFMYRAHESREDTQIFPVFKELVSPEEYAQLGKLFETIEQEQFGKQGHDHMLAVIFAIEQQLGIHDLSYYSTDISFA